jgi:FKBP-type peptidyl-prolyl cis-trans isomerase 2
MPIKSGDTVKVEYTGKLEDGTVFDSTDNHGGEPLEFQVGSGQLIPGFDKGVVGMEKGEEKEIKIPPKDGYGEHNPVMIKKLPKEGLPKEAKVGSILGMGLPTGQQIPAKIIEIDDKQVTLDMNHPLAGKTLIFRIKIVDYKS